MTDERRDAERQRLEDRATVKRLHAKPRAWTKYDHDRFDNVPFEAA